MIYWTQQLSIRLKIRCFVFCLDFIYSQHWIYVGCNKNSTYYYYVCNTTPLLLLSNIILSVSQCFARFWKKNNNKHFQFSHVLLILRLDEWKSTLHSSWMYPKKSMNHNTIIFCCWHVLCVVVTAFITTVKYSMSVCLCLGFNFHFSYSMTA